VTRRIPLVGSIYRVGMKPDRRERILDAAATVVSRLGVAGTTAEEIARVAGCSEDIVYAHFGDGNDVVRALLRDRLPDLSALVAELPGRAGKGTVAEHLGDLVRCAVPYFAAGMLVFASLYPRETLAEKQRTWLRERAAESEPEDSDQEDSDSEQDDSDAADAAGDQGAEDAGEPGERRQGRSPKTGNEGVSEYLRAEQRLGRVAAGVDPDVSATFLLNACYQQARTTRLMGGNLLAPPPAAFTDSVVGAALFGLGKP
jgi:AcrR family transcriptional regulator